MWRRKWVVASVACLTASWWFMQWMTVRLGLISPHRSVSAPLIAAAPSAGNISFDVPCTSRLFNRMSQIVTPVHDCDTKAERRWIQVYIIDLESAVLQNIQRLKTLHVCLFFSLFAFLVFTHRLTFQGFQHLRFKHN